MMTVEAAGLQDLVCDIFHAEGSSHEEASRIAASLVGANLAGHDSHGVARVPRYLQWVHEGVVHADQEVEIVTDTPVLAVVDGKHGFGQTVAPQAVQLGIDKCKAMGLAAVALRNAGHLGRIGDWGEMAAAANLISLHFVNVSGSVLVAPFGGVERRFSTAPICIGVPRPDAEPIILDFATSLVAEGKVYVASQGGKKIPDDALIGPDGTKSGDPRLLYGDYRQGEALNNQSGPGAIRAFGEHKGSGLAFMCEVLGGALTGNGATHFDRRWSSGMLSFYVDPQKLDTRDFFPPEITACIDFIKSAKPDRPGGEVLIPGEPEIRTRAERRANGIPLPDDIWAALVTAARNAKLGEPRIQAMTSPAA